MAPPSIGQLAEVTSTGVHSIQKPLDSIEEHFWFCYTQEDDSAVDFPLALKALMEEPKVPSVVRYQDSVTA